MGAFISILYSV